MIGLAMHNYHDVFGSFPPSRDMPEDVEVVEDDFLPIRLQKAFSLFP